jgi:hypothetical protein
MTSAATIACLDTRIPVQVTKKSDFFEDLCQGWNDSKTVVNLMQREAADIARYAWMAAKEQAERKPRPAFYAVINATAPVPRVTEDIAFSHARTHGMTRLLEAWEDAGEQPTVDLERRPRRRRGRIRSALNFVVLAVQMIWP